MAPSYHLNLDGRIEQGRAQFKRATQKMESRLAAQNKAEPSCSYHLEAVERAKKMLVHTGRDYRDGQKFLLASDKDVVSMMWELIHLVEMDAKQ